MSRITFRTLAAPAAMALALALGACGTGTENSGLESVHQPVVARTDYAIDVRQGADGGLAGGESARLHDWFESLKLGYGDRIAIDDRNAAGSGSSRDDVAAVAARYGLLLNESAPVTTGTVGENMVRVVVSRMTASVPGCPDWSRPSQPQLSASTMSNYGCATNANLAAMIANPEDLIQGQSGNSGSDGRSSSKAIKVFRDKIPSGTQELPTTTTKGQ